MNAENAENRRSAEREGFDLTSFRKSLLQPNLRYNHRYCNGLCIFDWLSLYWVVWRCLQYRSARILPDET